MFSINYKNKKTSFAGEYGALYSKIFKKNLFYEMNFLQYIESLAIKGVYLDIGGNIGNHSLFFANYCPVEKVYIFEPQKNYQEIIENNISANALYEKIELCKCGLSDSQNRVSFKMNTRTETITAPKTLDSFDDILNNITLIKIDVEGLECHVIRGGLHIIRKYKPRIFCEIIEQSHLVEIDTLLQNLGYVRTPRVFNPSPTYEYVCETLSFLK